jgi:hypothetical protein
MDTDDQLAVLAWGLIREWVRLYVGVIRRARDRAARAAARDGLLQFHLDPVCFQSK